MRVDRLTLRTGAVYQQRGCCTDAVREGTWLETAALAGIVRQHGGTCSVAAPDENATTVVVRLPSREDGAA